MLYQKYIKRILDFIASLLLIVVLSPILVTVALLVRTKLGAPILFKQERPGLNAKVFTICKFRTMKGGDLPDGDRLTSFGNKLRSLSIDELPELFNILKGDMSFVGPRPLLVRYLDRYSEEQARRHDVRPGLTGYAQVNGRNAISWEEKFKYDVEYVDRVSFMMDLKIVFLTGKAVLAREGISAAGEATMSEFKGSEGERK